MFIEAAYVIFFSFVRYFASRAVRGPDTSREFMTTVSLLRFRRFQELRNVDIPTEFIK